MLTTPRQPEIWRKKNGPGFVRRCLGLLPLTGIALAASPVAVAGGPVETVDADGIVYHVLVAEPPEIRILWMNDGGKPLRNFSRTLEFLRAQGQEPLVLMNGGIFEPRGIPSGLLIQNGKELNPLNTADGYGNFFLKPNGVFLIGEDGKTAQVLETGQFARLREENRLDPLYAVQSGPLLLRNGQVHPAFRAGSASRLHRNGVGVRDDGKIVLAMTDIDSPKFPNLHDFAELFRSRGCRDALFLDGDLSQMHWGEELGRASNRLGSIIAVVEGSGE